MALRRLRSCGWVILREMPPPRAGIGHQHGVAAGQRQIGGERRALAAALFLDDLHQDDLAALDDLLDLVGAHAAARPLGHLLQRVFGADLLDLFSLGRAVADVLNAFVLDQTTALGSVRRLQARHFGGVAFVASVITFAGFVALGTRFVALDGRLETSDCLGRFAVGIVVIAGAFRDYARAAGSAHVLIPRVIGLGRSFLYAGRLRADVIAIKCRRLRDRRVAAALFCVALLALLRSLPTRMLVMVMLVVMLVVVIMIVHALMPTFAGMIVVLVMMVVMVVMIVVVTVAVIVVDRVGAGALDLGNLLAASAASLVAASTASTAALTTSALPVVPSGLTTSAFTTLALSPAARHGFGACVRGGFFFRFGGCLFIEQRLPVGRRDLVVVGMDFAERQEAVAVAAVVDERRLQRRLHARHLGEINVAPQKLAGGDFRSRTPLPGLRVAPRPGSPPDAWHR